MATTTEISLDNTTREQLDSYYNQLAEKLPQVANVLEKKLDFMEKDRKIAELSFTNDQFYFAAFVIQQILALLNGQFESSFVNLVPINSRDTFINMCAYHAADAYKAWMAEKTYLYTTIKLDFFNRCTRILSKEHPKLYEFLNAFIGWKENIVTLYNIFHEERKERGDIITFVIETESIHEIDENSDIYQKRTGPTFTGHYRLFNTFEEYMRFDGRYQEMVNLIEKFYLENTYHCMWCHPWYGGIACHLLKKKYCLLESQNIPRHMGFKLETNNKWVSYIPDLHSYNNELGYGRKMDNQTYILHAMKKVLFDNCQNRSDYEKKYEEIVNEIWEKAEENTKQFHKLLSKLQVEVVKCYKECHDNMLDEKIWEEISANFQLLVGLIAFNTEVRIQNPPGNKTPTYSAVGRTRQAPPLRLGDIPIKVDKRLGRRKGK